MDKAYLSESLHDFFGDDPVAILSRKTSNKRTAVEVTTPIQRDDKTTTDTEELKVINKIISNDDTASIDGNTDNTSPPSKIDSLVIVQMDDGQPRLPRQSDSEVVIPFSPEFSPPKSSSSGSYYTSSDYTDSDYDDDASTDSEDNTSRAEEGESYARPDSVEDIGDGLSRNVADDDVEDSDPGSEPDDAGVTYDREMLFMHYKRANGQSIVEKVYVDISKFVEERGERLKTRSRSLSSKGILQTTSVTTTVKHHEGKKKANSAHCVLSTEKLSAYDKPTDNITARRAIESPTSSQESDNNPSESESESESEPDTESGEENNTDADDAGSGDDDNDNGNDNNGEDNEEDTDEAEKPDSVEQDDLKTKHFKILPEISKGTTDATTSQMSNPHIHSVPRTIQSGRLSKTTPKSATKESKLCTNRKPGIPHQLKSVACYQDGKVNVSILGDQRVFGESEPPYLNITFVHRPEPLVKKPANVEGNPEVRGKEERLSHHVKFAQQPKSTQGTRQAGPATRQPLPPIRKCSKPHPPVVRNSNVQKVIKPKMRKTTRNTQKYLPPLKGAPKLNQRHYFKRDGKKLNFKQKRFSTEFGIAMPRKLNSINWNIVDTRAQWPPFNTYVDPEASERHTKMITALPV